MDLLRTSASQVKDFRSCRRLWFYKTVLKQYQPPTEALQKGTTIHGALEAYLKAGVIDPEIAKQADALGLTAADLAEFVKAIEPFVGTPGEGVTEHRDEMPTYEGGPTWALVIDHAREVEIPGRGIIPQIDDLKTTSDFRYVKTPEQIASDVQMVSYAKWALRLYEDSQKPPPDFVSLRHVYVRTRGKRIGTKTDVLVSPEHVEERWAVILDDVRAMVDLARAAPDPQDITPSTDHCSAYGGCYLRPKCFGSIFSSTDPIAGLFTLEKNTMPNNVPPPSLSKPRLADRMKALSITPVAPAASPVPAPSVPAPAASSVPTPPTPPAAGTVTQMFPKCGDKCALAPDAFCTLEPHTGDHESRSDKGGVIHWTDARSIMLGPSESWKPIAAAALVTAPVLPPDSSSRESTATDVAAANAPRRRSRKSAAPASAPEAPRVAGVGYSPTVPTAAPAPASAAAPSVALAPAAASSVAPAPAAVVVAPPVIAATVVCPLQDLYVDCYPVKGEGDPPILAEGIIAECAAETATAAQVPDYRLASFSAAKGGFAVAVRKRLSSMPKVLVITSSTHGATELFEILAPYARRVVRGVRG